MKIKILYLLLCSFVLFSCDYYKVKKENEEAIKRERSEAIAKQKVIEEQESKKQNMKNNIAKYVYFKGTKIYNDTDYTIDKVVYEVFIKEKWITNPDGSISIDKHYNKYEQQEECYIEAHSERNISSLNVKITSIKCQALGIN